MHSEVISLNAEGAPIAKLVTLILLQASDKDIAQFSYFEDGLLEPEWCPTPPAKMAPNILNRLKIIAGLEPLRYQTPISGDFELVVLDARPHAPDAKQTVRGKVTIHDYLSPRRVDVEMLLEPKYAH